MKTFLLLALLALLAVLALTLGLEGPKATPPEVAPEKPPYVGMPVEPVTPVRPSSLAISGTVKQGSSGYTVADAKVSLFLAANPGETKREGPRFVPVRGHLWAEAKTNLAGRFQFPLPERAGDFFLRAEKEGFASAETPPFAIEKGASPSEFEIVLRREATLLVRVSSRGEPLRGAQVVLRGEDGEPRARLADGAGETTFLALAPGAYWAELVPPGIDLPRGKPSREEDVRLEEGERKELVLVWEGDSPGKVSGVVRVNDLPPQEPYTITFHPLESAKPFERYPMAPAFAVTGPNGPFQIERLAPGNYRVVVTKSPFLPPLAERSYTVAPGSSGRLDFSLSVGFVRGRLVDEAGAPLPQARVVLLAKDPGRESFSFAYWTDAEGRFRTDDMPPGQYEIAVHPPSGKSWSQPVSIERGENELGDLSGPAELPVKRD